MNTLFITSFVAPLVLIIIFVIIVKYVVQENFNGIKGKMGKDNEVEKSDWLDEYKKIPSPYDKKLVTSPEDTGIPKKVDDELIIMPVLCDKKDSCHYF